MKKLKCFLFVAAVALSLIGCRKPVEVSFAHASQEIEAQGGSIEVELKSNGEWTIDPVADWVTVSPMSGNGDATLTLTADANTGESRSTEIKAATKDNSAVLTLTQKAPQYYISVTPNEIQSGMEGGEFAVEVSANIDWTIESPQWVTCSMTEGSNNAMVTLTIAPIGGDFSTNRVGDVVFGNGTVSDMIHVVQAVEPVNPIEVNPNRLHFVCTGETLTVNVLCEEPWTATTMLDWITLSQTEGEANAELSVTVEENPLYEQRQGSVSFTNTSGASTVLIIRQDASPDPHFLDVSPLTFEFGKDGGNAEITVGCDTDWEFDLECDWLTLSQTTGTGNATVVLTAAPNVIQEARVFEFHIKSGTLSYDLNVSQEAGDEPLVGSFVPDTLYVTSTGGLQTVSLMSNTSWTLQFCDWVSSLTNAGVGDATFDMIVDSNQGSETRTGFVNAVHGGQVLCTMVIVQEGKPDLLEVDVDQFDVRPEGGEFSFHITSNQSWVISTDVNWIHPTPESGFANTDVNVVVDAMMTTHPREGHLVIKAASGKTVTVTVTQQH